ncbi:response regulator [Chryseobacterium wanjuense]
MVKKILITDSYYVVRVGTAFLLKSKLTAFCNISFADCYKEAKNKIINEKYDLLIIDINLDDKAFKAMIKEIKSIQENIKIIIFSIYAEDVAIQYIKEGADGYLNKNSSEADILNAVNSIFENGYFYTPKIMSMIVNGINKFH